MIVEQALNDYIGEKLSQIKVIGVGGGGCNAVDSMIAAGVRGVDFIAVNTDIQALRHSRAATRIRLGDDLTRGVGSGGSPAIGQRAAEESLEEIYAQLKGSDMIFITAGLGGGTGTGAAPVIADAARDMNILTIAAVTRPFGFEGNHRRKIAEQGLAQLRTVTDTMIVIPNDRLLQMSGRKTAMTRAFGLTDDILRQSIQGISDLMVQHGLINVDFGDVRAIMSRAGSALMGIGTGTGETRAIEAVNRAMASPLLDVSIEGAKGVLFNVTAGADLGLLEVQEAAERVARTVDPDANIVFGAVIDPEMPAGQIKITLIVTGFDPHRPGTRRKRFYPAPGTAERAPGASATGASAPVPHAAELASLHASSHAPDSSSFDIPPFLRYRNRGENERLEG